MALSDDGSTLAVGAWNETSTSTGVGSTDDDSTLTRSGAVYAYTVKSDYWSQKAYIKAPTTDIDDYFGSVALNNDGSMLAVGAEQEDGNGTGVCVTGDEACALTQANDDLEDAGAVYLY